MTFFGLKKGHDLENRAAHPHQEFPGIPPPGLFSQHDLGLQTLEVYESFYLYYIFLIASAYQLQHATRKFIKTRKA